jgi:hypothetical protein
MIQYEDQIWLVEVNDYLGNNWVEKTCEFPLEVSEI